MKTNHSFLTVKGIAKASLFVGLLHILSASGAFAAPLPAADTVYLQIIEADSTQVLFPVIDTPVISLDGNTVNVTSDTQTYSAEIESILDFSFLDNGSSALDYISANGSGIEVTGNSVIIKGLTKGEAAYLYSVNGMLAGSYQSDGGLVIIDLNRLASGVYILSVKNANYKIKK